MWGSVVGLLAEVRVRAVVLAGVLLGGEAGLGLLGEAWLLGEARLGLELLGLERLGLLGLELLRLLRLELLGLGLLGVGLAGVGLLGELLLGSAVGLLLRAVAEALLLLDVRCGAERAAASGPGHDQRDDQEA